MNVAEIAGAAIDALLELAAGAVSEAALAELRRLKPGAIERINVKATTVRVVDNRTAGSGI